MYGSGNCEYYIGKSPDNVYLCLSDLPSNGTVDVVGGADSTKMSNKSIKLPKVFIAARKIERLS